ncbi:hypothetical protein PILCRDRAFT_801024 [Piloderma croceum F 1598]|uniref:Serine/threonine-protein kinase TOR n=1 Tax=Piloderma croceum (strain F 1598) TaxID=765440 RepID=A0A0C3EPL6_PILCF|nr:hypothetical protein PILCRDRAFT_801024 [Piloderma croceum F 1598]
METGLPAVNAIATGQSSTISVSVDYYQTVVIAALLDTLKDQALSSQHHTVIEVVMSIFKTQGLKCVTFLPQIIPAFAAVTRSSTARLQEFHLQQLAILVSIIKQHVRNYMPEVSRLVTELWEHASLQLPIVSLIEALGKALDAELKPFLPTILPPIMKVFDGELTEKGIGTQIKIFDTFLTFGANIEEYLHLVIPIIVKSYERTDGTTALRKRAIQTIDGLSRRVNFSDHASRIIHPLVRVLEGPNNELRMAVMDAMGSGFGVVEVDTWLDVVPQIIARIRTPSANIRRNINSLLTEVGKHHPQALIYPLTVASKSTSASCVSVAVAIMDRMREHSATLVEQALVISQELIRVAILWHELWHKRLEKASRLYFTEMNSEGMIAALEPLHNMLEAGPKTARETSFFQTFGRDLHEAREDCRRYRIYGEISELDEAWEIYYGVFKKVEKQLPSLTTLDLQYISPELLKARNLELAVPGTYHPGRPIIRIISFATKLTVISSKQRPRRLSLKGSDGRDYHYCLRDANTHFFSQQYKYENLLGHEEMRQDERVMQLFGLINTLLSIDTNSFKRGLHIQLCPVTHLAPNAGLGPGE